MMVGALRDAALLGGGGTAGGLVPPKRKEMAASYGKSRCFT
jgi:hypothetical protein